ncbi:hypothetical protein [Streptomyces sp. NBC_01233]|uniref:hypothetical protein n=1 Tax=Streptomyces sp. NBC_01233 TaxID=2903787 RepID=UPI002E0E813A|nr:hypothetical protein OG332_25405 [Streptomyces sp. NBC_01233]
MSRPLRWAVVIGGTAIVFLLSFKLGQADPFGWLPDKDSDKVAAAAGFAGAMAAAFGLAGAWWASSGPGGAGAGQTVVRQRARASGTGQITQSGGSPAPGLLDQRARADDDSRVQQTTGTAPGTGTVPGTGTGTGSTAPTS